VTGGAVLTAQLPAVADDPVLDPDVHVAVDLLG
jgi:hypothetical protein